MGIGSSRYDVALVSIMILRTSPGVVGSRVSNGWGAVSLISGRSADSEKSLVRSTWVCNLTILSVKNSGKWFLKVLQKMYGLERLHSFMRNLINCSKQCFLIWCVNYHIRILCFLGWFYKINFPFCFFLMGFSMKISLWTDRWVFHQVFSCLPSFFYLAQCRHWTTGSLGGCCQFLWQWARV